MAEKDQAAQAAWWHAPGWGAVAGAVALASRVLAAAAVVLVVLAWMAGRLPTFAKGRFGWVRFGDASPRAMFGRAVLLAGMCGAALVMYVVMTW